MERVFSPAFELGTVIDESIFVYVDDAENIPAGTYNVTTNTFIANDFVGSGMTTLYVAGGTSCAYDIPWTVDGGLDSEGDGFSDCSDLCSATADLSLDFDGVDDHVSIPHHASTNLINGDFTFSSWVFITDSGSANSIISKGAGFGSPADDYIFDIFSTSFTQPGVVGLYLSGEWEFGNTLIPRNQWAHVAVSFDWATKTASFYLNGNLDGTKAYTTSSFSNSDTSPIIIGQQGTTCACNHFEGRLNDLQMWTKALTMAEINQYMGQRLDGDEANLLINLEYNNASASACLDNSTETTTLDSGPLGLVAGLNNFSLLEGCDSNYSPGRNQDVDQDGIGDSCDYECPASLMLNGNQMQNAVYQTGNLLESTQIISSPGIIEYHAGNDIQLDYPFEIKIGATFEALMDGCN